MGSGEVSEVSTIFHPRRSRRPSIVLSEDIPNLSYTSPAQVLLDSSGTEQQNFKSNSGCGDSGIGCRSNDYESDVGRRLGSGGVGNIGQVQGQLCPSVTYRQRHRLSLANCYSSCCAESAKKIYFGVCVTICVTASWVGATHCIKYLYFYKPEIIKDTVTDNNSVTGLHQEHLVHQYNAPFFTTWFCTNWAILYFPIYLLCQATTRKCSNPSEIIAESFRGFREKGLTGGRFLTRCSLFCGLWVATNYMYIHSLRILFATDVMALFATNVACVYLLSWVILHEQFVGVRIVAVILCDTGIALLAYMDGITGSPTLSGVVLAAAAAAGSAVYKVLFKKVIGETTFGQVSLFFSIIGLCNAALLWPVCLALYFSGAETIYWAKLPWSSLLAASILHLISNMLGNFSIALTYDLFITLGLITAIPVSAALDVVLYGAHFVGMKLAGMILIAIGFFLVMFPDNWPEYITRFLRTHPKKRSRTINRSRKPSFQQRNFRRNYGVSAAHGDGQTLLPLPGHNQINSSPHLQNSNNPLSSTPELASRAPTSTTTTTTSISTNINNFHRSLAGSQVQGGAGDIDMAFQVVQLAT